MGVRAAYGEALLCLACLEESVDKLSGLASLPLSSHLYFKYRSNSQDHAVYVYLDSEC